MVKSGKETHQERYNGQGLDDRCGIWKYRLIKNKYINCKNDFFLVNNVLSYTNHYSTQIGNILGSGYVRNYNPIAPEDLPENPKDLEVYRHNIQEYVDTAIQNAITTALNSDY